MTANTAEDPASENKLPEFSLFNIDWELTELNNGSYVLTELADGDHVRTVQFDSVAKLNNRVFYLKRDGSTIARVDTIGTTRSTYAPIANLA